MLGRRPDAGEHGMGLGQELLHVDGLGHSSSSGSTPQSRSGSIVSGSAPGMVLFMSLGQSAHSAGTRAAPWALLFLAGLAVSCVSSFASAVRDLGLGDILSLAAGGLGLPLAFAWPASA